MGPTGHPYNPYLAAGAPVPSATSSVVAPALPPNPFTHLGFNLRKQFDAASLAAFRYPQLSGSHMLPSYFNQFHRAPPPPLLHPGVGSFTYSPTATAASFQTLLANISAAQRPPQLTTKSPSDFLSSPGAQVSPPISPAESNKSIPSSNAPITPIMATSLSQNASAPQVSLAQESTTPPPEDRRSSSIAALRLKAREHEMRLEMLRQNGHDIMS